MSAGSADVIPHVKIVLLGLNDAGANSLTLRFLKHDFVENSPPTVGTTFVRQVVTVDGTDVRADFWSLLHHQHVEPA